ncbi:MAG: ABC transporter ATP-binding protein, partial [Nonomuraea sp.]|nr:ABC transporter ATP-binding protein [Nonomuraea sp.]
MTIAQSSDTSALGVIRRGLSLTPEFRKGLAVTLMLAVVATVGKIIVPVAVQQTIDTGLKTGTPDLPYISKAVILCAAAVVITALCGYVMNVRLYRATESSLATLRVSGFRHVHD